MQMMMLVQEMVSMVKPQKCMNPVTLIMDKITQSNTSMQAMKFDNSRRVVPKMQTKAKATLRYNSSAMICN